MFFQKGYKIEQSNVQLETDKKTRYAILMISMKIYRQGKDILVSACDEHLLGKKFKEGKMQIDASKHFYDGERVDAKTLGAYLKEATIANLVGKEAVECAMKMGLVSQTSVLRIKGVPHAQMCRML